ncbi:Plasmodium exported protein (PHIST), unknown, putative [Plasmodium sp. DRC-Itaito]|nr:Plasmodium exported protein (PHIST), unknown, putative [Plasmodium sp. DRC-Itaito]
MTNKQKCSFSPFYSADENKKGKLYFSSFKYLWLTLFMIGFFYIFLNKSLENQSFGIVKINNVYERNLGEIEKNNYWPQRKSNLMYKTEDVSKIQSNINKRKYNEQMVEKYENIINKNLGNINMEHKNSSYIKNVDYKNMSKNLTEKELRDGLNSLEGCPSKEDLKNIWSHTLGVAKGGLDNVLNMLKGLIQKYLDNDVYLGDDIDGYYDFLYERIWNVNRSGFCKTIANEEANYSKFFFRLINSKHTLDDILIYIYSFIEYFQMLQKNLHEKYQEEILRSIEQSFNEM